MYKNFPLTLESAQNSLADAADMGVHGCAGCFRIPLLQRLNDAPDLLPVGGDAVHYSGGGQPDAGYFADIEIDDVS